MLTKNTAALAALLTVAVADGGARVQAKGHAPFLLAKNDRTMIAPKLPPVTTRASKPAAAPPATAKAKTPAPAAEPSHAPPPSDDGNIDKDTIRTVVQRHLVEIKSCYEQALKDTPQLSGRLVVRFTLVTRDGAARISDGEIQPVEDGDYLDSTTMQSCVLQAFARWKFPPSVDGNDVVVSYPLVFKPNDE